MLIDIILWILLGALAGWIASKIMKTDAQQGAVANIIVGILGAFLGGFLLRTILGVETDAISIPGLIVAVLGAVVLLAIYKAVTGRSATH